MRSVVMTTDGRPQQGSQPRSTLVAAGMQEAGAPGMEAVQRATGRTLKMAWGWKTTRSAASTDTCTTKPCICHNLQRYVRYRV